MAHCTDLLVPRDLLTPSRPDEHFRPEAEAAHDLGIRVHLLDHDAIVAGDIETGIAGVGGPVTGLVYRGWMIPPERYEALASALADELVLVRTSPAHYRRAHQLPNWFAELKAFTPPSVWTHTAEIDEFLAAARALGPGPAVVKDYSKSEKHYWDEAMFIPDLADRYHAAAVAQRLAELRGDGFDTGFVLRRFEDFDGEEWRTWWIDGRCVAVGAHPDTPDAIPDRLDLDHLSSAVAALRLPFISVDVARPGAGGELRIVEIGDGQVSDRPTSFNPSRFVELIFVA